MDEVFTHFFNNGIWNRTSFLLCEFVCFSGDLLYILRNIRWLYINCSRCGQSIVIDCYTRWREPRRIVFAFIHRIRPFSLIKKKSSYPQSNSQLTFQKSTKTPDKSKGENLYMENLH